jgi:hypothetical protein
MVAAIALVAVLGALAAGSAEGFSSDERNLPNAARIRTTVSRSGASLGHATTTRGGALDDFGRAYEQQNRRWTVALCQADSDKDGIPNGVELGDPNCVWKSRADDNLVASAAVSDPGNSASKVVVAPPTPLPTARAPTTGNPTVVGARPTPKPTEFPTAPPTNEPGRDGGGAANDITTPAASSVSDANGAGISPAVLGAGAGFAALVVLAVVNKRQKQRGAAIVAAARMNADNGNMSMSPYGSSVESAPRGGQPGAGGKLTA